MPNKNHLATGPRYAVSAVLLGLGACAPQPPMVARDVADASTLPAASPDLLRYRNDSSNPFDAGGVLSTDSLSVYSDIDSYPLLHTVLLQPTADERVLALAAARALSVVGPCRVFEDVRQDARRSPTLFDAGVRHSLLIASGQPHIWIDQSVFIDAKDAPLDQARRVLERMADRIRSGTTFDQAWVEAEQAIPSTLVEGEVRRARVGNFGGFIVSAVDRGTSPFRSGGVPEHHLPMLLASKAADVLIGEDDAAEDGPRVVLYFVREAYHPRPLR